MSPFYYTCRKKNLNLFTIVFNNTTIINEQEKMLRSDHVFSALGIKTYSKQTSTSVSSPESLNILFHSEMCHITEVNLVLRAILVWLQLYSLYILVYFPVFPTSYSLIDPLLFVEPLRSCVKRDMCSSDVLLAYGNCYYRKLLLFSYSFSAVFMVLCLCLYEMKKGLKYL